MLSLIPDRGRRSRREVLRNRRDQPAGFSEQRIILTHHLGFGAMLTTTKASGPSIVPVRPPDVRPQTLAPLLIPIMRQYERGLNAGALLIMDEAILRVRLLPLADKS